MRTSEFLISGLEVRVHHYSDWSGEAIISWQEEGQMFAGNREPPRKEIKLPGEFLVELSKKVAKEYWRDKLIEFIENR